MATTVEEAGRHLVAGEVVHTAQRELDETRVLSILADEDGETHALNLQGHVDDTLRVAVLNAKHAAFLIGQSHYRGIHAGNGLHLHIEHVAHKAHAVGGRGPEYIAVDAVLVYATCQEQGDALVDNATRGGVGKGAGVGHHAGIEADRLVHGKAVHAPHLPKQVAKDFARGTHFGARHLEVAEGGIGVEVVVGHDHIKPTLRATLHAFGKESLHSQGTGSIVHVAHPEEVGLAEDGIRLVGMLVVADDIRSTGHPVEKVWKTVGDNHGTLLAQSLHPCRNRQGAAQGIAIGVDMTHTGHTLGLVYFVLQSKQLLLGDNLFHNRGQSYKE